MHRSLLYVALFGIANAFTCRRMMTMSTLQDSSQSKSKAIPFLLRPPKLDGKMAGDVNFDPLGLSSVEDLGPIDLYWFREAELKHSRVAMMAVLGLLAVESDFVLPIFSSGGSYHNGVDMFYALMKSHPALIVASVVFIGIVELISGIALTEGRKTGLREPGEFGFNPLKFGRSPKTKKDLATKEIKNGRLAMLSAALILAEETFSHAKALEGL